MSQPVSQSTVHLGVYSPLLFSLCRRAARLLLAIAVAAGRHGHRAAAAARARATALRHQAGKTRAAGEGALLLLLQQLVGQVDQVVIRRAAQRSAYA